MTMSPDKSHGYHLIRFLHQSFKWHYVYSISFYLYICSWLQTFSSSTIHSHPKSQETQILASYLQVICKTSLSSTHTKMGFRLSSIVRKASFTSSSKAMEVPKGYLAVYVGEKMKRFVIPLSYLNQPSFQDC
ncbi:hypothetical protein S83_006676 [Arachis hypogaea]|nr:Auxin-induced protein 6B [Arachis hypogaea]